MNRAAPWNLHRPTQVAELLRVHRIAIRRRLGQNFLVDANILRKVVEAGELSCRDVAVEIGAGLGILTRELAAGAGRVIAIEKDRRCMEVLKETTRGLDNVELIHGDALEVDFAELGRCGSCVKLVANLPYGISKTILRRLLDARASFERAVLMLQKEVADRLTAKPASKSYGPLAIAAQLFAGVEVIATVSPNSFFPPPAVRSTIVRLKFLARPRVAIRDEAILFRVVAAALQERRKTLFNSLVSTLEDCDRDQIRSALETSQVEGARRGETLTPMEFARLANTLAPDLNPADGTGERT